jgi:hypothetical protein
MPGSAGRPLLTRMIQMSLFMPSTNSDATKGDLLQRCRREIDDLLRAPRSQSASTKSIGIKMKRDGRQALSLA